MENNLEFIQSLIGLSPERISREIAQKDINSILPDLQKNEEFQNFCAQQLNAFLENKIAFRKKDLKAIEVWWKYGSNIPAELIEQALNKQKNNSFIQSDRYIDMQKDENFSKLAEHLEYIQEEMDMPNSPKTEDIRIDERQKIVDFLRFTESGKTGMKAIEEGNWAFLEKGLDKFPQIPSKLLIDLYEKKHEDTRQSDRESMLLRILLYRINDINQGNWKINQEELDVWENYLKDKDFLDNETITHFKEKLQEIRDKINAKSQKENKPTVINFVEENTSEALPQNEAQSREEKPQEEQPFQTGELGVNAEQAQEGNVAPNNPDKEENKQENKEENKEENPLLDIKTWNEEILSDWQEWGKEHHKIIMPNKDNNEDACSFKIFANEEKVKTDNFEADISYTKDDNINVKGKDGKVPPFEVFEELVAQAKKNGPEIVFGDIKNDEFKANLLLACLNDGHVKMVNAPYLEELKDIPQDLRKKIEEKKKEVIQARKRLKELKDKKEAYANRKKEPYNKERKPERKPYNKDKGERRNARPQYMPSRGKEM